MSESFNINAVQPRRAVKERLPLIIGYTNYMKQGNWRCEDSPSGAHHWTIDSQGEGECRYCHKKYDYKPAMLGRFIRKPKE